MWMRAPQPAPARSQELQSMSISPSLPIVNRSRGPIRVLDPYSTTSAGPFPVAKSPRQGGQPFGLELGGDSQYLLQVLGIEPDHDRPRRVEPRIGEQHSERREVARLWRNDHARNLERARKLGAV